MIRRKKLACLGLAASMAAPTALSTFSQLYADQPTGAAPSGGLQAQPTNADLLKQGIDQYNAGKYELSMATLQEVDVKSLNQQDHQMLVTMLAKADTAATERHAALTELARGDEARKANHMIEAEGHYNAVLSNARADTDTREKAQQQLALVRSAQTSDSGEGKAVYKQAVDEYRSGLWKQARADFNKAQDLGYTGGFLDASPAEYIKKLDDGEQKYVSQNKGDARAAYDRAREEYRSGDYAAARKDFIKARDLGFQPGYLEGLSPTEYLQRMSERDSADKQQATAVSGTSSASSQTVNLADDNTAAAPAAGGSDSQQLQHQADVDRLAQQQRAYKAQGLVDTAKIREKAGNDQEALDDYVQAVDLDPANTEAKAGRDRLNAKLGRAPAAGGATLTRTEQQIQQIISAINYKFETALEQARKDTSGGLFGPAENEIANAQAARDQDPTVFSADELGQMDTKIRQATLNLQRAKAAQLIEERRETALNTQRTETDIERREDAIRKQAVAAYIKMSRAQIDQQNYAAALGVLDQILAIDPQNDYALGIRQFVEDKAIIQEQRNYREEFDYNLAKTLNRADEAQIPYEDIYRFPENWPDIATLRDNELRNSNISKEDQAVQAQLDHRLPSVQLPQVALTDAVDFLRDITGSNILVNWKALEADGIDKQAQVSATLHDVKFSKVLDIILQEAGGGKLAYTLEDGVITISTADELNKAVATRVYDITDLLINPNFDPTIQNIGGGSAQVTGGGGGGGGQSLTAGGQAPTADRTQQLMDIKKKIENTVEFSSWKDNDPNGYGQIDDFNNQLIITQTSEVHTKIANLLAQLREAQAVQVSIEARFLTVSRHFIDDVGVNVSFTGNQNGSSHWSPISITNATSSFTAAPSTGLPGSLGLSPIGGLAVSASGFTDDFTVGLLLSAVQASSRLSVVHAPRVTLQNGQGATMYQITYIPYVSSLNTSVATGAAIAAPVIAYAQDGVQLIIERALVTADHKYVTLDLQPTLDSFLGFTTFQFETTATTATTANNTGSTTVITPGGFTPPSLSVQEATEARTSVRTRVTIPDGGTLMLGGVTIAGEINLEAGVPGLSKIPFLKRLTTNTSESNDEQVLLILVKPTILINKEIEAKNFPLLTGGATR